MEHFTFCLLYFICAFVYYKFFSSSKDKNFHYNFLVSPDTYTKDQETVVNVVNGRGNYPSPYPLLCIHTHSYPSL